MASVMFSIPDKVKAELKAFSWVNWSELAKQEVIKQHEKAKLFKELEELTKNSNLSDEDCLRLGKLVKKRFAKSEEKA